jgi:hypothetical protein
MNFNVVQDLNFDIGIESTVHVTVTENLTNLVSKLGLGKDPMTHIETKIRDVGVSILSLYSSHCAILG